MWTFSSFKSHRSTIKPSETLMWRLTLREDIPPIWMTWARQLGWVSASRHRWSRDWDRQLPEKSLKTLTQLWEQKVWLKWKIKGTSITKQQSNSAQWDRMKPLLTQILHQKNRRMSRHMITTKKMWTLSTWKPSNLAIWSLYKAPTLKTDSNHRAYLVREKTWSKARKTMKISLYRLYQMMSTGKGNLARCKLSTEK